MISALLASLVIKQRLKSLPAWHVVNVDGIPAAIVAGENIYTHQHRHGQGLRGAIEGAREVGTPVVFAVLTTVVAFLSFIFMTDRLSLFYVPLAVSVGIAMLARLVNPRYMYIVLPLCCLPAGAVGVVGPRRMNYGRIVQVVECIGETLSRYLDPQNGEAAR